MTTDPARFPERFRSLTGNLPFPWQEELYRRMMLGHFPDACDIPTGLGKTSIIPIWLIALADGGVGVPRRLAYVVNRRTVVDQATTEAEMIRERLAKADDLGIARSLRELAALRSPDPVAISTLRGQFADNREWSSDPSRPAIIVGTVDMIGSRLLFGGYGLGFKTRPLHAGFLGQDTLLVHDEAHLEPAFQSLIEAIRDEQERGPAPFGEGMRLKVMALTATPRSFADVSKILRISESDRSFEEVRKRIGAKKSVILTGSIDEKKLPDQLADCALSYEGQGRAVLVFARAVETVEKVAEKLRKVNPQVQVLTGTMRGLERNNLVNGDPIFQRFLGGDGPSEGTVYLVCTSAGEVGINLSADHLVCDLTTFDGMAQRFGRVNRFGDRDDTQIHVFHPETIDVKDEFSSRLEKTLALLRKLEGDGSPVALGKLDGAERLAAFSPPPKILPTSDILFDTWALTTIRDRLPGRPRLAPYLHGVEDFEPPVTRVAWREEVGVLANESGELSERPEPGELLEDYPLKPHEWLQDRSDRIFKHLAALAERSPSQPAWIVDDDGKVQERTLEELANKDQKEQIHGRTVLLPNSVGGLEGGLLNGRAMSPDRGNDVADEWLDEQKESRRHREWDIDAYPEMRLIRTIERETDGEPEESDRDPADEEDSPKRSWRWFIRSRSADDDGSKTSPIPVGWDHHTEDVTDNARKIVAKLPLSQIRRDAVVLAAWLHDLGKKRFVWQRGIGNPDPSNWLAKSGGKMKPRKLTTYRHEFGSLLNALEHPDFAGLDDEASDLVHHFLITHHGLGRPHVPTELAFDTEPRTKWNADAIASIAADVPRRFARLQRKYGRWGLAYLESLLRAADYAASANPSPRTEDPS